MTEFQRIRRWWRVRHWRNYWADHQILLYRARSRSWWLVLDEFNFERNYRFIQQFVRADQMRGLL